MAAAAGRHACDSCRGVWLLIVLLGDVLSKQSQHASRPASTRATMRQRWYGAVRAHATTAQQFAAYECTPPAVAEHPDLADVSGSAGCQLSS